MSDTFCTQVSGLCGTLHTQQKSGEYVTHSVHKSVDCVGHSIHNRSQVSESHILYTSQWIVWDTPLVLLTVYRYAEYRFVLVEKTKSAKNIWEPVFKGIIILGFLMADTSSKHLYIL